MQTLGMTDGGTVGVLLMELLMIFYGGYAAGCVLGNGIAALIYGRVGRIFITRNVSVHSGVSTNRYTYSQYRICRMQGRFILIGG